MKVVSSLILTTIPSVLVPNTPVIVVPASREPAFSAPPELKVISTASILVAETVVVVAIVAVNVSVPSPPSMVSVEP